MALDYGKKLGRNIGVKSILVNRITIQEGKGHRLVPVFIPPDVVSAMNFLFSKDVHRDLTVALENPYCFPSTGKCDNHVSGWHALMTCYKQTDADYKVNRTMNRHRVTTLIGALGLPECDQGLAYEHFGHSGEINRNVYQVPQAERQLNSTGRYLQLIVEVEVRHQQRRIQPIVLKVIMLIYNNS